MPVNEKAKILIVDDEPEICWIVKKALMEQGYGVHTSFNGEQGLEAFNTQQFDLVFLDVRLPGINGIEVLRQIREKNKSIPVVILSAFDDVSAAVQAMKLGAYDYLRKPLNLDELFITLANALNTRELMKEVDSLKKQIAKESDEKFIWSCAAMQRVMELVDKIASYDVTVLIQGESGTGKELIAEYLHSHSQRAQSPMVSLDCSALPETLIESELFGYERGAFTGATDRKLGRFEMANGGTLFLDEIGNLSPAIQIKLLRVLQERKLQRLGGRGEIEINVRLIAATNVDLQKAMAESRFREDLYHRLNEFTIALPPLRDREEDIELLARRFHRRFAEQFQKSNQQISVEAMERIKRHSWPGNVREMINAVKRAVIMAQAVIEPAHLPLEGSPRPAVREVFEPQPAMVAGSQSLKEITQAVAEKVERETITRVLQETRWNKVQAAKRLKINYKTLFNKMKELGI